MQTLLYILDETGEKPIALGADDTMLWGTWWKKHAADRRVKLTVLDRNRLAVSTVFLGINHNFMSDEHPILWETMVFNGKDDDDKPCTRCGGTREQALAMHEEMVERMEAMIALGELEPV